MFNIICRAYNRNFPTLFQIWGALKAAIHKQQIGGLNVLFKNYRKYVFSGLPGFQSEQYDNGCVSGGNLFRKFISFHGH